MFLILRIENMMQVKIFTIPFNSQMGIFGDEEFNDFSKDKELLSVSDYLFHRDEIPYLTLVVKYKQASSASSNPVFTGKALDKNKNKEEWRKLLNDDTMPLFNTLRQWRSEKSKKDGVPPYVILNNKQLAEICQKRPQSKYDLMKVEGVGMAKAEKYGDDILKFTSYSQVLKRNNEHSS